MTAKHKPTDEDREFTKNAAALGVPQEDIARKIGIDPKTLRLHYREELDNGALDANMTIGGALFKKAMGGDTAALIFWAKTRMGWKETTRNEHTDGEGKPLMLWGRPIDKP